MKLQRIELILATFICLFFCIVIYSQGVRNELNSYDFHAKPFLEHGLSFNYYYNNLYPRIAWVVMIYAAFVLYNNWIIPYFGERRKYEKAIVLTLLLFILSWIGFAYIELLQKSYEGKNIGRFLQQSEVLGSVTICFFIFFCYTAVKKGIIYLVKQNNNLKARIVRDFLLLFLISAVITIILIASNSGYVAGYWINISAFAYLLFCVLMYWFFPLQERKKYDNKLYFTYLILLSLVLFLPFIPFMLAINHAELVEILFLWMIIISILTPLYHFLYRQQRARIAQLLNLQLELGQTSADLSFLRSQINPHFLFNVLNTLYGTALQENAERTAGSIQKLGDMMRFMLHENNQDRIPLVREVEYLRNYIDLQQLRTDTSNNITVDADVQEIVSTSHIAPMLLIPFVENAFKHGIRLNRKSWIKINLYEDKNTLHLDVYNSTHPKSINDPEKQYSGIGLDNVKQRLALLYPDQHELISRENTQEYFIHLTIQL